MKSLRYVEFGGFSKSGKDYVILEYKNGEYYKVLVDFEKTKDTEKAAKILSEVIKTDYETEGYFDISEQWDHRTIASFSDAERHLNYILNRVRNTMRRCLLNLFRGDQKWYETEKENLRKYEYVLGVGEDGLKIDYDRDNGIPCGFWFNDIYYEVYDETKEKYDKENEKH